MEKAIILGCRGSVPVCRADSMRHGGATTCILVHLAGEWLVLDAGTGILELESHLPDSVRHIPLLLSHTHADHILGLPMCSALFDPEKRIAVYGATRNGLTVGQQIGRLMAPPLWPVGVGELPAAVTFHELRPVQRIGAVEVAAMEGSHPGGVTLLRLRGAGRTVVFLTDCTLDAHNAAAAAAFAQGCDLLLIDGQYSPEEWEKYRDFGHNTWLHAAQFGARCGAKTVRILHHAPARTDRALDEAARDFAAIHTQCAFAKAGEEIQL